MIELSPQQSAAVKALQGLLSEGKPLVTLGGYAGSGKSTIIPHVVEKLDAEKTAFCCFTGKAAQVLRGKLSAAGVADRAGYVGTIHGLIYQLREADKHGRLEWDLKTSLGGIRTIVVDEASMVGKRILDDLLRYGVQILAVGDPAQLPPVQDDSVMMQPDFVLTEVHRQAEGSPIIRVATHVREHGHLPDTDDVVFIEYDQADEVIDGLDAKDWAVLTRSNATRVHLNEQLCGKQPKVGSTVVCLRNDWNAGLYNGLRGTVTRAPEKLSTKFRPHHTWLECSFPDTGNTQKIEDVNLRQFNRERALNPHLMVTEYRTPKLGTLLDFGTAMTVHKAQGSGFHTTMVVPETWDWNRNEKEDWKKWLYTAVTRATDKLYFLPKG